MDMTTQARVLTNIAGKGQSVTDATAKDYVDLLLAQWSAEFERFMGRTVLAASTTEYFTPLGGQQVFALKAWPVTAVASVFNDVNRDWTTGEISSDDYYMDLARGVLHVETGVVPSPGSVRVIYTGGMAATAAAFIVAYPDIAAACDVQIAAHYQRQKQLGAVSSSQGQGSVSHDGPLKLLPTVRSTLMTHRRMIVG